MKDIFTNQLKTYQEEIEQELERVSRVEPCLQQKVYDAMAYSLLAGGKRIRPVLVLAFADLLEVPREDAMPFAVALEMIHTYSLIHDDLPAMDNDDLRRGKPTNHVVYGEATAILAGDGLLNRAFEIIGAYLEQKPFVEGIAAMNILSKAAGCRGMIAGQVVDMEGETRTLSGDELLYMHENKTGALIEAACLMPFALAGLSGTEEFENIRQFAKEVGLAFQMKDDILDVESSTEVLGKPIGSDAAQGKTTFVTMYGISRCKEEMNAYTERAKKRLAGYGEKAMFLQRMVEYLLRREK